MLSLEKLSENNLEEKMGIFTIYYKPIVAEHDLQFKKNNDQEKFLQSFNRRFLNKFQEQGLKLSANLAEEEFSGTVEQIKIDIKAQTFQNKYKESKFTFEKLIGNYSNRSNLLKLYNSMSAAMLSPIYTGFSLDVREDILNIRGNYLEAKQIRKHASDMDDDIGCKLAAIGKPKEILFDFQYFNDTDVSKSELSDIGIVLEWILKQQIRNKLG